jgi:hypothetical protein
MDLVALVVVVPAADQWDPQPLVTWTQVAVVVVVVMLYLAQVAQVVQA